MTRSSAFRPDIEGLRGIAVLIVVAYHCGVPHFSGGFVGVDVFFVLSGYLITGLLVREIQRTGELRLAEFYARRIRRLLPAAGLTVVATLVISALILAPDEITFTGRAARAAALYLSNWFFAANAANYFAPDVKTNPLLHTWSLAVEEQFYLFWPLVILLGLRVFRSLKPLAVVTVLSFGVCSWGTRHGVSAFYQLPARAWEFGVGGLAVLVPRGVVKWPHALGWLGIAAILASAVWIAGTADFPGWLALVPALGTAAALIACADWPNILLRSRPLQVLGTLSYSWYLWHWPVLVFSIALFPNLSMYGKIGAAAASLGLAAVTHRLVENPIRFHPFLGRRPAFCVALAAGVMVVSLSVATLSMRLAGHLANAPAMKTITAAADDIAALSTQQCVALGETAHARTCVFGDPQSATSVVLFGDSHALQWFNPLRRLAESRGWQLTTMLKSGCPATDIQPPHSTARFAAGCAKWRAEAIRQIVAIQPSLVFIASASVYMRAGVPVPEWQSGTSRTLAALAAGGAEVAVMRDNPIAAFDVPTCVARSIRHAWRGACQMERAAALDPAVFEAEKAGARNLPHVHFIDLTDQFCRNDTCWAVRNGEVLYRDDNHLTGKAAERLAPVIETALLPWVYAKPSLYR